MSNKWSRGKAEEAIYDNKITYANPAENRYAKSWTIYIELILNSRRKHKSRGPLEFIALYLREGKEALQVATRR